MRLVIKCLMLTFPIFLSSSPFYTPKTSEDLIEQRAFLETNGYLWIRHFYDDEGINTLYRWAEIIHEKAKIQLSEGDFTGDLIVVPEANNSQMVCRTEDNTTCFTDFGDWILSTVQSFLSELTNEPYVIFKDKLNFKWPGGGAFSPHQDFPAFASFPPRLHLNAMVCIDSATNENGCLQVTSNWKELLSDQNQILPFVEGGKFHGMIEKEYTDQCEWLPLETQPGDLVIFTSFIPHFSHSNQSEKPRRALFFTFNRFSEGEHNRNYYNMKRNDPENPIFHIGTPTKARTK